MLKYFDSLFFDSALFHTQQKHHTQDTSRRVWFVIVVVNKTQQLKFLLLSNKKYSTTGLMRKIGLSIFLLHWSAIKFFLSFLVFWLVLYRVVIIFKCEFVWREKCFDFDDFDWLFLIWPCFFFCLFTFSLDELLPESRVLTFNKQTCNN